MPVIDEISSPKLIQIHVVAFKILISIDATLFPTTVKLDCILIIFLTVDSVNESKLEIFKG